MNTGNNALSFLGGGGKVAQLIALKDWSDTRLGAPLAWPGWLRAIVNLALNSKFPMFVAVGEEHEFLYNDAYAEILGGKHPQALGARFADVWSDIWDDIHPIVQQSMEGVSSHWKNMPLVTIAKATTSRPGLDINGYTTHVRHSSQAALELAGEGDIDVFIPDIGLPGMDGCELARRLPSLPASAGSHLIALTGYGQPEDRRRTAEAGFDVHLVKPADFAVMLSVLSDIAQRRLSLA